MSAAVDWAYQALTMGLGVATVYLAATFSIKVGAFTAGAFMDLTAGLVVAQEDVSSALGLGPQLAMQVAERLYTQAIPEQKARHILLHLTSEELLERWCIIRFWVIMCRNSYLLAL